MPKLFITIDVETELFSEYDAEVETPIVSIGNIVLNYKGFTEVEHNYDIYVSEEDFVGEFVKEISPEAPFIVKLKGLVNIDVKKDLHVIILEDEDRKVILRSLDCDPYCTLEYRPDTTAVRMSCDVSAKKPKL